MDGEVGLVDEAAACDGDAEPSGGNIAGHGGVLRQWQDVALGSVSHFRNKRLRFNMWPSVVRDHLIPCISFYACNRSFSGGIFKPYDPYSSISLSGEAVILLGIRNATAFL